MPKRALAAVLIFAAVLPVLALAQAPAPLKWTDETLKQESYATPPKELVDAVMAPRHRNVALTNATWSPDGLLIAFDVHTPDATHIWVADPVTGLSKQLTPRP